MKKLYLTAAMIALSVTSANATTFVEGKRSYSQAVVETPISIRSSSDYNVSNDLVLNNTISLLSSGDLNVGGSLFANAPVRLMSSGDVNVRGDLVIRSEVNLMSSGDLNVGGKIYVVEGQGSIKSLSSGDVNGEVVYVRAAELPERYVNVAPGTTVVTTTTTEETVPVRKVRQRSYVRPAAPANTVVRSGGSTVHIRENGGDDVITVDGMRITDKEDGTSIIETPGHTLIAR